MAAGLATFREVLTRENYVHVGKLSKKLTEGYRTIVKKAGIQGYIASAGVNGALMLYPEEIRNYRDWTKSTSICGVNSGSAWLIAVCWRCPTGGTSSGRFPCNIRKRISTNIWRSSRKLRPVWPRHKPNVVRRSLEQRATKSGSERFEQRGHGQPQHSGGC